GGSVRPPQRLQKAIRNVRKTVNENPDRKELEWQGTFLNEPWTQPRPDNRAREKNQNQANRRCRANNVLDRTRIESLQFPEPARAECTAGRIYCSHQARRNHP